MVETISEKINEFNSILHWVSCIRMTKLDFRPGEALGVPGG
jgi:hypothetical protein